MSSQVRFSRHNPGDTTLNILWVFIYNFFSFASFLWEEEKKRSVSPSWYPPSHSPRYSGSTSGSFHYELLSCYYALLSSSCFENRENLQFFVLIEVWKTACFLVLSSPCFAHPSPLSLPPALPPPLFSFFLSLSPLRTPQLGVWTVCE